ncbi:hypothetical protein P9112_006520 [Eukaryota sp. TZLM1-RC]
MPDLTPTRSNSRVDIGVHESSGVVVDFAEISPDVDEHLTVSPSKLLAVRKDDEELSKIRDPSIRKFYSQQNCQVDALLEAHQVTVTDQSTPNDNSDTGGVRTSRVSLIANIFLLLIKSFVFYVSGSLSIFASVLDSFLDLVSGTILALTTRISRNHDKIKYPAGKKRAEPLGVIVFATLMGIVSVQVIIEAIQRLIQSSFEVQFSILDLLLMASVVLIKLLLWLYCRQFASKSSAAEALAQDHSNDVLTNIFGTTCAYLSTILYGWVDPAGAIVFSLYILYTWVSTLFEQISVMMGRSASPALVKKLTFVALNHDPRITQLCTVRAFHFGSNVFVEIDIVLPPEMPLEEAHGIGESLQNKLEKLSEVERAFVHIDIDPHHDVEDEHGIQL